jgi:hypothetical protein
LQDISAVTEDLIFSLALDIAPSYSELRKIEAIVMKVGQIIKKMGFGETVDQVIDGINKINMGVRLLQVTVHAFEIAIGPIGWIYAGVTLVSTVMTLSDMG